MVILVPLCPGESITQSGLPDGAVKFHRLPLKRGIRLVLLDDDRVDSKLMLWSGQYFEDLVPNILRVFGSMEIAIFLKTLPSA